MTEAPIYLGAAILFLFLFSFLLIRSHHKWWIMAAVILTVFMSGGNNFSILNKFFFDYLPYFNAWRAPSSVLAVTVFLLPLMIALGAKELKSLKRDRNGSLIDQHFKKSFFISGGITLGICLVVLLLERMLNGTICFVV